MAGKARVRRSWKKRTQKKRKRSLELLDRYIVKMHQLFGDTESFNLTSKLAMDLYVIRNSFNLHYKSGSPPYI